MSTGFEKGTKEDKTSAKEWCETAREIVGLKTESTGKEKGTVETIEVDSEQSRFKSKFEHVQKLIAAVGKLIEKDDFKAASPNPIGAAVKLHVKYAKEVEEIETTATSTTNYKDANSELGKIEKAINQNHRTLKSAGTIAKLSEKYKGLAPKIEHGKKIPGTISIEDRIEIDPEKFQDLKEEEVNGLMKAIKEDDEETLKKFTASGTHRMRLNKHAEQAEGFLGKMRPGDKEFETLWNDAPQTARFRAFDLFNAHSKSPLTKNINKQSAAYAMALKPKTIFEFVNHFEFYNTFFQEQALQQAFQLAKQRDPSAKSSSKGERNKARTALDAQMGGDSLSTTAIENVKQEYEGYKEAMEKIGVGIHQLSGPVETLEARRDAAKSEAGKLMFSEISSAAYHVQKHYNELPKIDKVEDPKFTKYENRAASYLNSARRAIRNAKTWEPQVGQWGGESHKFTLELLAIVRVDGQSAFIATYFSK
jgi:hypothetical protein